MRGAVLYGPRDVRFEERKTFLRVYQDERTVEAEIEVPLTRRRSSNRPMPSSGSQPPACAGPTCGPTAALARSPKPRIGNVFHLHTQ